MLSNRCVICLSIGIVLLGLAYNHCSLQCLLKSLSYIPFIGNAVLNFNGPDDTAASSSARQNNAAASEQFAPTPTPPPPSNDDVTKSLPDTNSPSDGLLFTQEELALYNGEKGLYLSILGTVYDVGKGSKYYAKGQTYHGFTGKHFSDWFSYDAPINSFLM